jgi:hypothetical protein
MPRGAVAMLVSDHPIACLKIVSSGPRPAQHPASWPSTKTLGRLRIPCCFALAATCLMHVVNFNVVARSRNAPYEVHCLVTGEATGSENLNLSFWKSFSW